MNCNLRNCTALACGTLTRSDGVELAFCAAHERICRNLPELRAPNAAFCASAGCMSAPGRRSPLCSSCRPRYAAWGLDGTLRTTEPTMPAPEAPPTPPPAAPQEAADAGAASPDDAEPSAGDVAEAAAAAEVEAATVDSPFPGRWGQQHSALTEGPPARGHEPTAPGPTMADLQARVIAAEQRADRAELDAVSERARGDLLGEDAATQRARAEAAEQQLAAVTADRYERLLDDMTQSRDAALNELHEVGHALYLLGSDSDATAYEALCHILPPDRLVDLRRVEEALAAAEVARVRCRRGSAEALADAIAAHGSAVHRLSEAEQAARVAS